MLAAMVEEADVVVLALERPDLALDEGVQLAQVGRDLRGNAEIHGACSVGRSLRRRQVDPEAAAAALCRKADCGAVVAAGDVAHQSEAEPAAAAGLARRGGTIERLE